MTIFRSTKGASKQRRDLINGEIGNLRDLLPLTESSRQRLSQLQIMSLTCCYIRKCNYFQRLFSSSEFDNNPAFEFAQTMTGFLVITTKDGKLLYISENVTQFLGHSMVDMLTQGDSLYDIIDKKDHGVVKAQLQSETEAERTFFCKMNVSRSFRRQSGFGDSKVMHVRGHFINPGTNDIYGNQPVFMALCSPLITPDVKDNMIQHNTMVYQTVHTLAMKFIELANNGEFHIGYSDDEIKGKSWYDFIHPDDLFEAKDKHTQLLKSSHEMGCMLTIRLQHKNGTWVWLNMVMHIRQPFICDNTDPAIVCINHAISESEAQHFKMQSQLYSSHIARSPEFLNSPSGSSPSHTITHVAMERSQMANTSYSEMNVDDGGTMFYRGEINMAPVSAIMGDNQPNQGGIGIVHSDITTLQQNSFQATENKKPAISRADIMNRLKRKMSEIKPECKPAKITRTTITNANKNRGGAPSMNDVMMSFTADDFINFGSFDNQGGQQVITAAPVRYNPTPKSSIPTVLGPQGISITHQPLTPLSPASSISSDNSEFFVNRFDANVGAAIVPSSVLTPDITPVNSPDNELDDSIASFFESFDNSKFQEQEKQIKPVIEKKKHKTLPLLDALGLEKYLSTMTEEPKAEIKDEFNMIKTEVPSRTSSPDTNIGSPQSMCSELEMENTTMDAIQSTNPDSWASLISTLENELLNAPIPTTVSGDLMMVPSDSSPQQVAPSSEDTIEDLIDFQSFTPSYGSDSLQSAMYN